MTNRFPKINDQWMIIFPEPITIPPSASPTAQPTIHATFYPTPSRKIVPMPQFNQPHHYPVNEISNYPFVISSFPSAGKDDDKTVYPTPSRTIVPTPQFNQPHHYPVNETSNYPFISPSFPSAGKDNDDFDSNTTIPSSKERFNISLANMGADNSYDDSFQKAKSTFEKIIIGDLLDQPAVSKGLPLSTRSWKSKLTAPVPAPAPHPTGKYKN